MSFHTHKTFTCMRFMLIVVLAVALAMVISLISSMAVAVRPLLSVALGRLHQLHFGPHDELVMLTILNVVKMMLAMKHRLHVNYFVSFLKKRRKHNLQLVRQTIAGVLFALLLRFLAAMKQITINQYSPLIAR